MTEEMQEVSENKDQTPHVFLATPMYGGQCFGGYVDSVLGLSNVLKQKEWNFTYFYSANDALIQRARNFAVHQFLQTDATHLLFIDSDIVFYPPDIVKMIEADKDIVCGMYPKKLVNWNSIVQLVQDGVDAQSLPVASAQYVFNVLEDGDPNIKFGDHTIEIRHGGTGYMLIKREVFESLKEVTATYTNDYYLANVGEEFYNFFSFGIDKSLLLSEDWFFCDSWIKQGGKIHLAAWALARHLGTFVYG